MNSYGHQPQPAGPYGQPPYGHDPHGQGPYGHDPYGAPQAPRATEDDVQRFTTRVFGWMGMGLGLTAFVAWMLYQTGYVWDIVTSGLALPLFLVQIGLVWYLSARIYKLSLPAAMGLFLFYSAFNGVVFSSIFVLYELGSIAMVFGITTLMFGFMFVLGWTTKRDLTSMGSFLIMGVWGLVIASLANFLLKSPALYWAVTYIGVGIFIGLIAYDAQKIRRMAEQGDVDSEVQQKNSIIMALAIYLDFINLFLLLLRILGNRR